MKRITIGRSENCTICYDANVISRNHALINIYPSGKYEIVNMGTNGTRVNGNRVANGQRYPLKRGDTVVFADQCHLDWDLVPDPMKPWRITGYVLAGALVLGLLGFGAKWAMDKNMFSFGGSSDEVIEAPAPAPGAEKTDENKATEDKGKSETPEATQEKEGTDGKASPWKLDKTDKDSKDKTDKNRKGDKSGKSDKSDKDNKNNNNNGNNKKKNDKKSDDQKAETEENTDFR